MDMNDPLCRPNALLDGLAARAKVTWTGPEGRRICWRSWGEGPGKPVLVLLHGGSGSWRHWVRQIEPLSRLAHVVVPDLPGYGDSDDVIYPLNFAVMVRQVAAGLDETIGSDTRYFLAAFSYGGSVTAELITAHPDRQNALVFCAAAGFGAPGNPLMHKVRGLSGPALTEAHRKNLCSIMLADPASVDDLALRIQHENSVLSRLRINKHERGLSLPETLPDYSGRIIAIWGERDNFMIPGRLEERRNALLTAAPRAEVIMVPGAGHWLPYEAADTVTDTISGILPG